MQCVQNLSAGSQPCDDITLVDIVESSDLGARQGTAAKDSLWSKFCVSLEVMS